MNRNNDKPPDKDADMNQSAREAIFNQLNRMNPPAPKPRPTRISQVDLPADIDGMIATFSQHMTALKGEVYRVSGTAGVLDQLQTIVAANNLKSVMTSSDTTVQGLALKDWGAGQAIEVLSADDYTDPVAFKEALFNQVDAGITSADYAFSESATLGICHNRNQARLVSLAPPLHIAIVPVDRLHRYYEDALVQLFADRDRIPSQLTLISGPSLTADIAATPTVGMHGPKKVIVIFVT